MKAYNFSSVHLCVPQGHDMVSDVTSFISGHHLITTSSFSFSHPTPTPQWTSCVVAIYWLVILPRIQSFTWYWRSPLSSPCSRCCLPSSLQPSASHLSSLPCLPSFLLLHSLGARYYPLSRPSIKPSCQVSSPAISILSQRPCRLSPHLTSAAHPSLGSSMVFPLRRASQI
jgi:hypothetical protein